MRKVLFVVSIFLFGTTLSGMHITQPPVTSPFSQCIALLNNDTSSDKPQKTHITRFCQKAARMDTGLSAQRISELPYKNSLDNVRRYGWQTFVSNNDVIGDKAKAFIDTTSEHVGAVVLHGLQQNTATPMGVLLDFVREQKIPMALGLAGWALYCIKRFEQGSKFDDLDQEKVPLRILCIAHALYMEKEEEKVALNQQANDVTQEVKDDLTTLPIEEPGVTGAPTSFSIDRVFHRVISH